MISATGKGTTERHEYYMRRADLAEETLHPDPEEIKLFGCPFDDCVKQSETEYGVRQHIAMVHDPWYNRAKVECQQCDERFLAIRSKLREAAFCSRDCKHEFGIGGGVSGSPTIIDPPIPVETTRETRFPCPMEDCDVVCATPKSFRKHATQVHNGRGRVTLSCEFCGDTFHVGASVADRARFCSKKCLARGVTPPTRYRLHELDPEDVGLSSIGERRDPFDSEPARAPRPIPTRPSWGGKRPVNGGRVGNGDSPWGRLATAIAGLYERDRTIVGARNIAEELEDMSSCQVGWYLQDVADQDAFWQGVLEEHGIRIITVENNGGARTYYLRGVDDDTFHASPDVAEPSDITFGVCSGWRETVRDTNDLDTVVDASRFDEPLIREHVTGRCDHGFDSAGTMPVRCNGVEWTEVDIGAEAPTRQAPRKAPTFETYNAR